MSRMDPRLREDDGKGGLTEKGANPVFSNGES